MRNPYKVHKASESIHVCTVSSSLDLFEPETEIAPFDPPTPKTPS